MDWVLINDILMTSFVCVSTFISFDLFNKHVIAWKNSNEDPNNKITCFVFAIRIPLANFA